MSGLGRSLSLNTGSSLFGGAAATSQSQTSGGLFGSSTTTSQPAQTGGLFGASTGTGSQAPRPAPLNLGAAAQPATSSLFSTPSTSQPATGGGLFGAAAPAASKPGGLFGSTTTTSAPATGLFATPATTTSAAPSGGLFGNTAAQPAAPSTGLFGNTAAQPAASQPAAGGLFGAKPAAPAGGLFGSTTTTPQPAAGGLFGAPAAPASQPATGGLFGAPAAPASQPATGGLFGAKPAAPAGGLFASQPAPPAASSSLFGALNNANPAAAPAQQSVPAVKIDWSNVKPTTRFNELHQEVQDAIVFIDEVIQGAMRASMQCSEAIPGLGRQTDALPADVDYLERRLETVEGALGRDAVAVSQNKKVIEKDSEDAVRLFRAIENLKLPNQFHYSTIGSGFQADADADGANATDLLGYFATRAEELEAKTKLFDRHQREVDAHLRTVEHSAVESMQKLGRRNGEGASGEGLREIAGVMRTFEEAILRVAERIGEDRERVVDLSLGGGVR